MHAEADRRGRHGHARPRGGPARRAERERANLGRILPAEQIAAQKDDLPRAVDARTPRERDRPVLGDGRGLPDAERAVALARDIDQLITINPAEGGDDEVVLR
ncbi:MAG: hypothetical protein FJ096_09485 [Deltaproteobacteria bacterium]|nr:hypothetical protein [Deltaproteobacteria bacterium]